MKLFNAKSLPERYYGLHMVSGVAEYRSPNKDAYRVFVGNEAIKVMNSTFDGRPVFVRHVPEVNLATLEQDADGYVVRSFFNQADGNHWVEFLAVSDEAKQKIREGWKLSNCYDPKTFGAGGLCNGVTYDKEILSGVFDHLAIVPDPRYEESVILTPEQFKQYNEEKEMQLMRLANSKKGESKMFKLFKREKVENSADYENMVIELPKSKKEVTIARLVNDADDVEEKKDEPQMANGEHHVMFGSEKMKVNELVAKHQAMCNEYEALKKSNAEKKPEGEESPEEKEKKANAEKELADKDEKEKKANAEKEVERKENAFFFNDLDKADSEALKNARENMVVDLAMDQVARGQARYGSAKK